MNKQELIARNTGVKLYDLSYPSDMHRMNVNLAYCSKKSKEPSFKIIAPYGHPLKYKADFYYFESENTQITEQILEEMKFQEMTTDSMVLYLDEIKIHVVFSESYKPLLVINRKVKSLNANQLFTLIELLK